MMQTITAPFRLIRDGIGWMDCGLDLLHINFHGSCDIDDHNYQSHPGFVGRSVTQIGWKERIADAVKVFAYNVIAFIGNAVRFGTYLALSIAFPIGMACGKWGAKKKDLFMVYKRCWKNLTFMVSNVVHVVKYALSATLASPLIGIYRSHYVHRRVIVDPPLEQQ